MWTNFISETEMPGTKVTQDQLQIIYHRYYFTSKYISGKCVLEVGCGPGLGLGYLSRSAKQVIGGDITRDSLRVAQEHYQGRIGLTLMDAHKLPFRNGSFDVVVCLAAIIYLDLPVFIDECHRVLKKDGTMILNSPNQDQPGFKGSHLSNKYYSVPVLYKLLKQNNFDVNLFGAFLIKSPQGRSFPKKILKTMCWRGGKFLDLIPKGKWMKESLNKFIVPHILSASIVLKEEIEEGIVDNVQVIPIPGDYPDIQHRILYIIAQTREPEMFNCRSEN